MKERPIIFSAPMVRAILDGRKTQTRRVAKIARIDAHPQDARVKIATMAGRGEQFWMNCQPEHPQHITRACPYGVPGDRLWVRETWQAFFADEVPADRPRGPRHTMGIPAQPERESFVFYRADGDLSHPEDGSEAIWRSPIHMPRWASRITLEIVSVRVERLQEISEEDAIAEGFEARPFPGPWWQGYMEHDGRLIHQQRCGEEPPDWMIEPKRMSDTKHLDRSAVDGFRSIWFDLHGGDSWSSNPWVWVIEFRRVGE